MIAKSTCLLALASTALYASSPTETVPATPFDELTLTLEANVNDVDGEVILHAESGMPLERVALFDPLGRPVHSLSGRRGGIGLSEFRLESGEPTLPMVRAAYPEGVYTVRGMTIDGGYVQGEVELSHAVPARCRITSPLENEAVEPSAVSIAWQGDPSVAKFTVEIEGEDDDAKLMVHLPGSRRAFQVPAGILEGNTDYQVVLISHSVEGNRTIQETWFRTTP